MENAPTLKALRSLSEQVDSLRRLVYSTRQILERIEQTLPSNVIDNLAEISTELNRMDRQVRQYESGNEKLMALVNISQLINSSLETGEVLRIVMDTIIRLTRAERGFLMLRDDSGELTIRIARNWEQETIDPSEFAISHTIVHGVITDGQPVLTTNALEDPRFGGQKSIVAYNLRSILCVPLKVKDEITGVIYADNRIHSGVFTMTDRDLLSAFANQAAVALENARLFESVRKTLAEVTQLKGLMDNVFASIASGVITTDADNRITLANRIAETILGFQGKSIVGQTLRDILPSLAHTLSSYIETVWRTDVSLTGLDFNYVLPGRGPVALRLSISPLKDAARITQGMAIVLNDLTDTKRMEAERRMFERMISPAVIEQLDPDQLQLVGKRAEITTLFADIRGFTTFSESISPERLVAVLNCYLASAAEAILEQAGTIDKFLGDAVMAWFNAPIPQADHTLRAIRAALNLQKSVCSLQGELPEEHFLSFGVGIHYGEAVLGLIGTEKRLEYTAIGDSVNTARRIQESAAAGQILISAEAYQRVSRNVIARPVAAVLAKGKSQPIQVYEVISLLEKRE